MYNIILFLIIFLSFLLVLVIMVQNPKGGGLASTFGGDSQQIGGVKKTTDFLDKSTWILVSLLFLLILFSNITLNSGNENTWYFTAESSILKWWSFNLIFIGWVIFIPFLNFSN